MFPKLISKRTLFRNPFECYNDCIKGAKWKNNKYTYIKNNMEHEVKGSI
jgi:hypothetical protein